MKYISLTRNSDFSRCYKKGKNWVHPHIVVYLNKNRCGYTRVGITASKKVGGAVQRNRARRVIRAALYNILPHNIGGYDFVFVARGATVKLTTMQIEKTLRLYFKQANLPNMPGV